MYVYPSLSEAEWIIQLDTDYAQNDREQLPLLG